MLLAGDAAHVHSPVGGQGLNIGVQDAVNLGWKLAQVVKGRRRTACWIPTTPNAIRSPPACCAPRWRRSRSSDPTTRAEALREIIAELLSMDEPRKRFAAMMSGLDIHYDLGEGHPLLGRRMPDLDLVTANGPPRVFTLLHEARPVLLNLGEPGGFDITPWADRVQLIDADYAGAWELPALGDGAAPAAVLIRPDGYVAWVGDGTQSGLRKRWHAGSDRRHRRRETIRRPLQCLSGPWFEDEATEALPTCPQPKTTKCPRRSASPGRWHPCARRQPWHRPIAARHAAPRPRGR